jgi:hypothetical protein
VTSISFFGQILDKGIIKSTPSKNLGCSEFAISKDFEGTENDVMAIKDPTGRLLSQLIFNTLRI